MAIDQPDSDRAALDKMLRFNDLLDAYGALLTDRQRRLAIKHFQQDLSFSEIAREEGVSRQAAHDAVKHAGLTLERFEAHLGLVARGPGTAAEAPDAAPHGNAAAERLEALARQLEAMEDRTVDRQWIVDALREILALLAPDRQQTME